MKKVSLFMAVIALVVTGLSVNPQLGNKQSAIQEADAGVVAFGMFFWNKSFRRGLGDWCNESVRSRDWQPLRFVWFGATCVIGFVFGDEDENQSATSYLSADHPYVKKGITTRGGVTVKFSEEGRKFYNDHRNDFVDAAEAARDALEDYRVKDGGATTDELLKDFQKIIAEQINEQIEDSKEYNTPAGREALQNFIALQFNTAAKKEK